MGSDYGSSGLAILVASNRTHRPLITISYCLIMGIDYGSLGSLNPPICDRLKALKGALFRSTLLTRPQTRVCGFSSPETLQTRVST